LRILYDSCIPRYDMRTAKGFTVVFHNVVDGWRTIYCIIYNYIIFSFYFFIVYRARRRVPNIWTIGPGLTASSMYNKFGNYIINYEILHIAVYPLPHNIFLYGFSAITCARLRSTAYYDDVNIRYYHFLIKFRVNQIVEKYI
jgi:hypothetical protein